MDTPALALRDAQVLTHAPGCSTLDSSSERELATLLGALSASDEASLRSATKPYVQELAEFRAQRSWRIMSALNERSRCRVWTGGFGYRAVGDYGVTAHVPSGELPTVPVAVHAYDHRDCASSLFLDFDAKQATADQVKADVALVVRILIHLGLPWITSVNDSLGRHVYVSLDRSRERSVIRRLIPVLASGLPSLDPTVMMGSSAAIRVPGVRSRSGVGFQLALQSDEELRAFVRSRADRCAVDRLFELRWIRELDLENVFVAPVVKSPRPGTSRPRVRLRRPAGPPERIRKMALSGQRDEQRYPTSSEARLAIVSAYRWAGYAARDVERLIATELCGYRALCEHRREPWRALLARDLATAEDVDEQADPRLRAPGDGAHVVAAGRWLAEARKLLPPTGERRFELRLLVEAIARVAAHAGLREIEASFRYLGVAAGLGWQRVRTLMTELVELGAVSPLPREHLRATSRWMLRTPDHATPADAIPEFEAAWAAAALGPRARALWTGLEEAETATGLGKLLGVDRATVTIDLNLLAEHGLVTRTGRTRNTRWTRTEVTPEEAALRAGLIEAVDGAAVKMLAESRAFAASGIRVCPEARDPGDDSERHGGPAEVGVHSSRSRERIGPDPLAATSAREIRSGKSGNARLVDMKTSRAHKKTIPSAQCATETRTDRLASEDARATSNASAAKSELHRVPIPDLVTEKLFPAYVAAVDDEELRRLPRRRPRRSDLIVEEMTRRGVNLVAARRRHLAARGIGPVD